MTNNNKFNYKIETFTEENDISYYLLGVFITDGNVSLQKSSRGNKRYYSCELKSADHAWLKQIAKLCGDGLQLTQANNSDCLRLRIHNTKIGEWLIAHNCVPNKTLSIQLPNIPDIYLPDFIRGCWDGDGSISLMKRKNGYLEPKLQLYSASKDFIYALQKIFVENYNTVSHIYEVKMQEHKMSNGTIITAKNQLYQMCIGGNENCKKFLTGVYYPDHKLSMPRKLAIANKILYRI